MGKLPTVENLRTVRVGESMGLFWREIAWRSVAQLVLKNNFQKNTAERLFDSTDVSYYVNKHQQPERSGASVFITLSL